MEIDYKGVKSRLECDDELLYEILEAFLEDAPSQVEQLMAALAAGDIALAERCIHSIKGMSGNIGATRLRSIAVDLEKSLKAGNYDAARDFYTPLAECVELVMEEIRCLPCS